MACYRVTFIFYWGEKCWLDHTASCCKHGNLPRNFMSSWATISFSRINLLIFLIYIGCFTMLSLLRNYVSCKQTYQWCCDPWTGRKTWRNLLFYIYILIRAEEMQQYAGVYLLQNYSTCFGCLSHTSSGVHQTVIAAAGAGHSVRATTFLQRGLIRPRWRKVVALTIWHVPEVAFIVWCTPDDRCDRHPKHVE